MADHRGLPGRHSAWAAARLRIGTAEREQAVAELKEHTHAGRLELHEFDERIGRAFAARTAGELAALTSDLPSLQSLSAARPAGRRPAARGCFGVFVRGLLAAYASVCLLAVLIWALAGGGYFWPIWVIGPLGVITLPPLLLVWGRRRGSA